MNGAGAAASPSRMNSRVSARRTAPRIAGTRLASRRSLVSNRRARSTNHGASGSRLAASACSTCARSPVGRGIRRPKRRWRCWTRRRRTRTPSKPAPSKPKPMGAIGARVGAVAVWAEPSASPDLFDSDVRPGAELDGVSWRASVEVVEDDAGALTGPMRTREPAPLVPLPRMGEVVLVGTLGCRAGTEVSPAPCPPASLSAVGGNTSVQPG